MPISLQMGRGVDDVFAVYKIRREEKCQEKDI